MEKETRVLDLSTSKLAVEKREDGTTKISGYAAIFNSDSEDMGFIERIKPGAFKSALKKSDVRALFNHDPNLIIGRSGVNLNLKEDKTGLHIEVSPLATSTYKMVEENISAGLVTQQSFAFTVEEDEWNDDYTQRTVKKVGQIFDVSPVTYPAYSDTTVALRCRQELMEKRDKQEVEPIQIRDGETVFSFTDKDQIERVVKKITLEEVEHIAFRFAQEEYSYDEPIPEYSTRFPGSLESCIAAPFQKFAGKFLYSKLIGKAAILFYFMIKNHPFQNGNKRIAMTTLFVFLYNNNKWIDVDPKELYNFTVWVAQSPPTVRNETVAAIEAFLKKYITKLHKQ